MRLSDDVRHDIAAAKKLRLPWWALLTIGVGSLSVYWLFDQFGKLNVALPLVDCILVFGFIFAVKWELRGRAWFWVTMVILALLHVPLVLFVPWTGKWIPAVVIAVVASADICLVLWAIAIVGRIVERSSSSNNGDTSSSGATSEVQ